MARRSMLFTRDLNVVIKKLPTFTEKAHDVTISACRKYRGFPSFSVSLKNKLLKEYLRTLLKEHLKVLKESRKSLRTFAIEKATFPLLRLPFRSTLLSI